jgi:hypothetical protein
MTVSSDDREQRESAPDARGRRLHASRGAAPPAIAPAGSSRPRRCTRTTAGTTIRTSPRAPATSVTEERARSIVSRNDSPDIPFDQSINPYRGCEHGCVYCYARPSHAYLNLSPGLDFETRLFAKTNAVERSAPSSRARATAAA